MGFYSSFTSSTFTVTYILHNCMQGQRTIVSFLTSVYFVDFFFFCMIESVETRNIGSKVKDVGWSSATLACCMSCSSRNEKSHLEKNYPREMR